MIRRATKQDIGPILELLHQVNMVHYNLRPDLFKPYTTKYNERELTSLLADAALQFYRSMGMGVQKTTMEVKLKQ